jgi:hypothetical protein
MHTINTRQARAMAICAPGTLAIREDSGPNSLILVVSTDDRMRSGVCRIDIDGAGNVTYHLTNCSEVRESYLDLIVRDNEARLEMIAGVA